MKISFFALFAFFTVAFICDDAAASLSYRKGGNFKPIKLTYDDMSTILERIYNILPPSETQDERSYLINTVTVGDGNLQVEIELTDDFQIRKLGRMPSVSFDFAYSFYSPESKIEKIDIHFSDYKREVWIKGSDPDQVDALYSYLVGEINRHTILIGGTKFRSMVGFIPYTIGMLLIMLPGILLLIPEPLKINLSNKFTFILIGLGLLILVTTLALPYDRWLPGFAIYSESPSVLVRYSSQISFFGTFLGIVSVILTCIALFRSEIRTLQKEQDGIREDTREVSQNTKSTGSAKRQVRKGKGGRNREK